MLFNKSVRPLVLFILANLVFRAYGQHAIGLELNLNKDKVVIMDPGNQIKPTRRLNVMAGASYKYTFKKGFNLSAGLSFKHFKESVGLGSINFNSTGNMVAQLPLIAGQNFYLLKDKIYISPLLGGTFNLMLLYNSGSTGGGTAGGKTDSLSFRYHTVDFQQYFLTLNAGLQIGFNLSKSFSVFLFSRYNAGFKTISRQYITYRHNLDPEQEAVQTINGSYLTFFGLGVNYALKPKE